MQRDFYRVKEICMDLGITPKTLYAKIADGTLPPLDKPIPLNSRYVGYSADKLSKLHNLLIPTGQKLKYDASINTVQIADTTI